MTEPLLSSSPEVLASACPLDCPDACSLEVRVVDGRVVKVDGSRLNPVTQGYICAKVRRVPEHLYGPDRLLYPARRVGPKGAGGFERISWEAAYDLAAEKLREARERWGGESVLPFCYGGSNGLLTQDTTDARLFHRLGASRLARTVCAAPSGRAATGLYGKMAGVALPDFRHARLIVLWGVNPSATGIHLVPFLQEAQKAGARLVVIDPRRTPLAKRADLHLAVRPGGDLAIALAAIRWLFEEGQADLDFLARHATGAEELLRRALPWTFERAAEASGVPAGEIERFVRLYAEFSPAVIRTGWGFERNRNGGSAVAAALALPAVAGKFGVRGGGYTMSNSGVWGSSVDRDAAVMEPEPATRTINMNRLGETLLEAEPPVLALFVYNCNPLATMPNQEKVRRGLAREDLFTVVFDQVWTDSARWADLVLPATHFLEHSDLVRGYGAYALYRTRPVAAPAGEARPNMEVFGELTRRLGLDRPEDPRTDDELRRGAARPRRTGARRDRARRPRRARLRHGAGPVRRRLPADPGPQDPPRPRGARRRGAARPLRFPGRSGQRALSAGADLAGHRPHDQLDLRAARARAGGAGDPPGRRRGPRDRGGRPGADLERPRRGAGGGAAQPGPAARGRLPAQGAVEPRHALGHHGQRARSRHPGGPRRRGLLQRRAGGSGKARVKGDRRSPLQPRPQQV